MPNDTVSLTELGTVLGTNLHAQPFITVDVGSGRKPAPARNSGQMSVTTEGFPGDAFP